MIRIWTASTFAVITLVAIGQADDRPANLLQNPGAEAGKGDKPSIWFAAKGPEPIKGLAMTRVTDEKHDGKASLAIVFEGPDPPQPIAFNWAQPLTEVPTGKTVRLTAWIKTRDADAVNVCLQCWAPGARPGPDEKLVAFGSTPVVRGDQAWKKFRSEPIAVPEGTTSILVRAALTGSGRAWFDDLAVTIEPTAPSPKKPDEKPAEATKSEDEAPFVARYFEEIRPSAPPAPRGRANFPTVSMEPSLANLLGGRPIRALPVEKDVMVISYLPGWGRGDVDNLAVGNYDGGVRALIGLPEVPRFDRDDPGVRFVLAVYCRKIKDAPGTSGTLQVRSISGEWGEQTSWTSQPPASDVPISTHPFEPTVGWKTFDVTGAIRDPKADGRRAGVLLRFEDESRKEPHRLEYDFASRESAEHRPILMVVEDPKLAKP